MLTLLTDATKKVEYCVLAMANGVFIGTIFFLVGFAKIDQLTIFHYNAHVH